MSPAVFRVSAEVQRSGVPTSALFGQDRPYRVVGIFRPISRNVSHWTVRKRGALVYRMRWWWQFMLWCAWRALKISYRRCPMRIRSPDRPARRQSLYRLRYPAHKHWYIFTKLYAAKWLNTVITVIKRRKIKWFSIYVLRPNAQIQLYYKVAQNIRTHLSAYPALLQISSSTISFSESGCISPCPSRKVTEACSVTSPSEV